MIGLDTNVVVRCLVHDPQQSAGRAGLSTGARCPSRVFLGPVTVVEVHWVLRRAYQVHPDRCGELIAGLLDARELVVGEQDVVRAALAPPAHFVDAVVAELGRAVRCTHPLSFDHRATVDLDAAAHRRRARARQ